MAGRSGRLKGFLAVSVILHLNLFLVVAVVAKLRPDNPSELPLNPFEVSLVSDKEVQDARLEEQKKEELKEEEKKEEEKDKDVKGQVVEIAPPKEEKQPESSKFLSEYDSKVAKQTKGPPLPNKPGERAPERVGREVQPRPPSPPQPQQPQQQPEQKKAMKLAMRSSEPELPRSELPKSDSGDEPARVEGQPEKEVQGQPQRQPSPAARKITMKDLQLSDEELGRAVGGGTNDYLKDVAEGEQTLLNTKRWRFATFFNRVKRQVAQNWHPDVVYRRRDPSGNVYGFRDRLTVLRVRLTPQGRLKDLHLEKPCGVGFLDDEAIAAFKAAEPFPNPPPGLVDKDTGMISFRFGFLFEISARPGFRIFRYND